MVKNKILLFLIISSNSFLINAMEGSSSTTSETIEYSQAQESRYPFPEFVVPILLQKVRNKIDEIEVRNMNIESSQKEIIKALEDDPDADMSELHKGIQHNLKKITELENEIINLEIEFLNLPANILASWECPGIEETSQE